MQTAIVLGTATATVKHPSMRRWKLLVVQPTLVDGRTPDGDPQLAVDCLGAGRGEQVIISSDGAYTRQLLNADNTPVRWSVIGICDPKPSRNSDPMPSTVATRDDARMSNTP
jgi:microcompartment protein CcmK/EutM